MAGILMAQSGTVMTLSDVVDIAEQIAESSSRIYFKPHPDGAAHWTLRLRIADGIIVTLTQLDDSPTTAVTTTILALLLSTLDSVVRTRLLDADHIPRQEVTINVVSRRELEAQSESGLPILADMRSGFGVAESTDITLKDQPPIVVVRTNKFPTPWCPTEHALSDFHLLLNDLLRVLITHILARNIEPEVLLPKIGKIIARCGYRGPADRRHPRE